ncbi:MAG: HD family phosphohydrolase [Muribaculaceae bacterium]
MKTPEKSLTQRVLIALASVALIVWFYPHQHSVKYHYEEGRPWNYAQLIAPFDIPVHVDSATIVQSQDSLSKHFRPVYSIDKSVVDSVIMALPPTMAFMRDNVEQTLRNIYKSGVVEDSVIIAAKAGQLHNIRILSGNVLHDVSTNNLISPREFFAHLDSLIPNEIVRRYVITHDVHKLIRPNVIFNEHETLRLYNAELQTLTADRGVILQGQAIINKGDIITAQDYTNLRTYEQLKREADSTTHRSWLMSLVGQVLYVSILLGVLLVYLLMLVPRIAGNMRAFIFIISLVTLFVLITIGMYQYVPGGLYIVPMAIVPVLVVAFFGGRTALAVAIITILLCAPITPFPLEYTALHFIASAVAIYTLGELRRRSQLMRMALAVAAAYVAVYVAMELMMNGAVEGFSWRMGIILGINALLTSMAYLLMFAAERIFGFVSVVTLVEYSDINQPLLRKLSDNCPGTFQHSMGVSNLAADAARAIGANEQLVRAGALYHDIGKMVNPAFFTENQHGVNPHDALTPRQSAQIVIGHVTEGLRMAEKEGLPEIIVDFIREHHGCGKAKYFYYTHCQVNPEHSAEDEKDFTYPGPNPRSRETSVMMMADAIEAASRSLKEYTRESIIELVNRLVDAQIAEGLHADSTLQLRDIKAVKEAFVRRLQTMYHTRVAYPAAVTGESNTNAQ